jgi:hypothetical protein
MTWDNFSQFLGEILTIGGGGAVIAYGIFSLVGKKWLEKVFSEKLEEFKHKQDLQMEQYRFEINTLYNRILKIHDKEFDVLPTLWNKLQCASREALIFTSPYREYPDLNHMSNKQIEESLAKVNFSESQKSSIKQAADKLKAYEDQIFWVNYNKTAKLVDDLHEYILINKIFLNDELFTSVNQIDKILRDSLIELSVLKEAGEPIRRYKIFKNIRENLPKIENKIGMQIQQRLHYNDTN